MPKAEGSEQEDLESGQRYGLMEDERVVSGCKRICFCYGFTLSWCEYKCIPYFLILMYPIVFIMGFYSGLNSNCSCNTTLI